MTGHPRKGLIQVREDFVFDAATDRQTLHDAVTRPEFARGMIIAAVVMAGVWTVFTDRMGTLNHGDMFGIVALMVAAGVGQSRHRQIRALQELVRRLEKRLDDAGGRNLGPDGTDC